MKKSLLLIIIALTVNSLFTGQLFAQLLPEDIYPDEVYKEINSEFVGSGAAGTDFWLTFHPGHESSGFDGGITIYVSSEFETEVTLEIPGRQKLIRKKTIPGDIIEFRLLANEAQCYSKGVEDPPLPQKVYPGHGIHVYSDKPITCYGLSRFYLTTDGFQILPTKALGTEYVVAAWQDYTDDFYDYYYTSYLSVVGVHENTTVELTLGGNENTCTPGPNSLSFGDTDKKKLQPGDVWLIGVMGDYSDATGTYIKSDKPVSVISGNFRTSLPTGASRDYLIQQNTPVHSWGKEYHVTPIIERKHASMIRVFAGEENAVLYRNGQEWGRIPKVGGKDKEGWISRRAMPKGHAYETDPVLITSDKRIAVTQYNPTANDDGVASDPFQMRLNPVQSYVTSCVFHVPGVDMHPTFQDNYMNFVYKATENGQMPDFIEYGMPKNGTINWVPFNTVATNPGKPFRDGVTSDSREWKCLSFRLGDPAGVYALRSDEPFMAYVYGFQVADSYGYPAAGRIYDYAKEDSTAPHALISRDCNGKVEGYVKDMPEAEEFRTNLREVKLAEASSNYKYTRIDTADFIPGMTREIEFELNVQNPGEDAVAYLYAEDNRGNDTVFIFEYRRHGLEFIPEEYVESIRDDHTDIEEFVFSAIHTSSDSIIVDSLILGSSISEDADETGFYLSDAIWTENGGFLPGYEPAEGDTAQYSVFFDPGRVDYEEDMNPHFQDSVIVKGSSIVDGVECEFSDIAGYLHMQITRVVEKAELIAPDNQSVTNRYPDFIWAESKNAEGNLFQLASDMQFDNIILKEETQDTTFAVSAPLEQKQEYFWRVQAFNSGDTADWSDTWSFTALFPAPKLVSPVDGAIHTLKQPTFEWEAVENADSYRIHIGTTDAFDSLVTNRMTTSLSYNQPDPLEPLTQYWWKVQAGSADVISDWSEIRSFTTEPAASVLETNQTEITITPNPASTSIEIECNEVITEVKIFDMRGNLMLGADSGKIDISTLPSGTYVVTVNSKLKSKFIKR